MSPTLCGRVVVSSLYIPDQVMTIFVECFYMEFTVQQEELTRAHFSPAWVLSHYPLGMPTLCLPIYLAHCWFWVILVGRYESVVTIFLPRGVPETYYLLLCL